MTSAAYEGSPADIAAARDLARAFLTRVQADHGLPVSERVMGVVQLVVSELVTNACKHAPGPCLVDLELSGDSVGIAVWDTTPVLPVAKAADPGRVGQHGLEIVMAVCQGFEVHREPVGKRITASVMLADDPGGDVAGRSPV
ncbi:ATP-binding protein [Streptomyces olivaceoviridis]|uniref:ATP-binding protein n=1 Tax=Streptomyces olivaceoviridis TaxID=1921 RepID=UPI0037035820